MASVLRLKTYQKRVIENRKRKQQLKPKHGVFR